MELLSEKRILLVEDCEIHHKLFSKFLEPLSVEVVEYGKKAIELFDKTGDFDLVLLDIHMPVMSGFDVFRLLKNRIKNRNSRAKIIAASADVSAGSIAFAEKLGFDAFLPKPFTRQELIGVLEYVSLQEQAIS